MPTFVLVDPFGYSQTPFSLIARLMKQAKCEVLINFMYEEINRFLSVESQRTNFDNLFGSDAWRACIGLTDPEDRKQCIQDAYQRQLKDKAGIQFVRSFEMINDGRTTDYFLFFGTNNYAGLRAMKPATWRVDRLGGYQFSDRSDSAQPYLIEPEPNRELLKQLIVDRFKGTTFTETQLERFVVIETPFLDTHYKREILYQSLRMKS